MSVETDPVPPVPEHSPPLREDEVQPKDEKLISQPWARWFTSLRAKINVINESLVNLLGITGIGFVVKNGALWAVRTFQAGAGIDITNPTGAAGDPVISHEDTSSVGNLTSDNSGTVVIQDITFTFDTFGHVLTATVGVVDVAGALSGTYQPLDATLSALAANNWAANALPIGSGADTVAQVTFAANTFPARASTGNLVAKPITDFGLSLVDDANAAAARTTIGAEATITAGTTSQFWVGDKTWNNYLAGAIGSGGAYAGDATLIIASVGSYWAQGSGAANTPRFVAVKAADTGAGGQFIGARAGNTLASLTATPSGVSLFELYGSSYTGSAWAYPSLLVFTTTELHSGTARGTEASIRITANGTTSLITSQRWGNDRHWYPGADNVTNIGSSALRIANTFSKNLLPGAGSATWTSGSGTPEGVLVAAIGSLYTRTDGGAGTTLYVKESGAGNTGWIAK